MNNFELWRGMPQMMLKGKNATKETKMKGCHKHACQRGVSWTKWKKGEYEDYKWEHLT